jgi:hypothetical protein
MLCEAVIAVLLALFGIYLVAIGLLYGHRDPHHGGVYPILFGSLVLLAAGAVGFGALCLRGTSGSGWIAQLFPFAILVWVIWDVLSHPG